MTDPRPNVLLISIDSLRRDLLGIYGHDPTFAPGRSPSPNLDALAREGVRFDAASATTSWTLPAHVSLLTGEPELVHGVEGDADAPEGAGLATRNVEFKRRMLELADKLFELEIAVHQGRFEALGQGYSELTKLKSIGHDEYQ